MKAKMINIGINRVRSANVKPWRCDKAIWLSICLCALTFSVARGAHTPVITPVVCKWYDEEVIIVPAGLSKEDQTEIDKLLKDLVALTGLAIGPEVEVMNKAIKKLGPGQENIDVIIIYACKDNAGVIHRRKQTLTLDGGETMAWWPKTTLAAGDVAREKERLIKKYSKPGESCCKATPTPTLTPTPPPPTPTSTPKPTPPRTYTGPQPPTPTPQEHGMAPRPPRKTGETCAVLVAAGKIKIETSGTGETIGHVADLKIRNLIDQPLTCAIAPMILESGSGKNQHYACPTGQTVALNPHQTKTVPMNGVCLNRNKPPVGKGVSGDLVINEANPSGPQNPNSHMPPADAGKLLRICTSKYGAADKLQKDGALKALPYKDKQKQRDIVVQWSTWCDPRIAQITGAPPATKEDLRKVVYKQVEAKGPMAPETKKKVDQGIDTIFEKVELTTAKAKDLEKPGEEIPAVAAPAVQEAPAGGVPVAAPRRGTLHPCEPQLKPGEIEGPDELEVDQEKDYSVEVTSDCGNCYETDGEGGIIAGTFKTCEKKLTYKWTYTPHQIGVAGDIEYTGGTEDTKSKIKGKKAGEVLLSFKVWLECEKQSDRCYKMTSDEKKKVITVIPPKKK